MTKEYLWLICSRHICIIINENVSAYKDKDLQSCFNERFVSVCMTNLKGAKNGVEMRKRLREIFQPLHLRLRINRRQEEESMGKYVLEQPGNTNEKVGQMLVRFRRKIRAYPPGICPLTVQLSLLQTSKNQTCGKCVPCRDGLVQLERLLKSILSGEANMETLDEMEALASLIRDTADCAIGYESAEVVLAGLKEFRDEYISHIVNHSCQAEIEQKIPCTTLCPAHVDIPEYIALIGEERYADAIRVIRKDNPFPTACAMICEHPCEARCRRNLIDRSLNIRGLKKFAVDQIAADKVPTPKCNVSTGRKIAVAGGGPSGLTTAYFLALMGHKVVIFEEREKLGGMLRYGIPNYRFPKERLDEDINAILATGDIEVRYRTAIGKDISVEEIYQTYDALYVAIGAQKGKKLRMEGEDSKNVISAVGMLSDIGNGNIPDYTGKRVVVIGGGNVAMDCARTAIRCHAAEVSVVYRRRQDDMTALPDEIEGAVMEGVELMTLQAPLRIEADGEGSCAALWVQPQRIGTYDAAGRPRPVNASKEPVRIACDVILIAVGQDIISAPFEEFGIPADRKCIVTTPECAVEERPGVYAGGDCVTGPSTVIKAIAAGKVAAHNIDEYLGYHHKLHCDVKIPHAKPNNRIPTGRVNITEREARVRKHDFEHVENTLSYEEAMQEANRCLRCDHFGCGVMEGGRD